MNALSSLSFTREPHQVHDPHVTKIKSETVQDPSLPNSVPTAFPFPPLFCLEFSTAWFFPD
jgi:hypothetical protein